MSWIPGQDTQIHRQRHTQMDDRMSIEQDMWEERRQRLEALLGDNPSQQQQDPAQTKTFMDRQLYLAAKEGDVDKFIKALEDHCAKEGVTLPVVLKLRSPSQNTLLHAAAESDDIVRAIIDFVPKKLISAENSKAETALLIAARAGKTKAVELLLPHGTDDRALHEAMRNRHYDVIRLFVRERPDLLYRQNREGKSPWFLAAETGDLRVLLCLLEVPNEGEDQRRFKNLDNLVISPAHVAIKDKRMDMLTEMWNNKPWLLKSRAEESFISVDLDMLTKITDEEPGIFQEEVLDNHPVHPKRLKMIFDSKPWLYSRDEESCTPLHFAAYTNYLDGVKFLIERLPKSVLQQESKHGYLPIHVACMMDHVRIVEELLRLWPDPAEFTTAHEENILHVSARHGSISTVEYILKNPKCDLLINARDYNNNTPLHLAALHWQPAVLLFLTRDERVDLKLVNRNNMTALDMFEGNIQGIYAPLRKCLTRITLASAGTPRSGELTISKPTDWIKKKELEPPELARLKEEANTGMVIATLVAAMTFASGFSVPGAYNGSNPDAGIAVLLYKAMYDVFVICNSIAMYSSIIALVILLWTQIIDPHVVRYALSKARVPLLVALAAMPLAFMAGVYVTVTKLAWLAIVVLVLGSVALFIILSCYLLPYVPLGVHNPLVRRLTDLILVAGISVSSTGSVTAGSRTSGGAATSSGGTPDNKYRLHMD